MRRTQKDGLFNLHVNQETETDSFEGAGDKGGWYERGAKLNNIF
ncbi:hypothetical protein BN132_810 [Cronobacter turicensis 564]|nr:hypothetical protein BN132_810 [Cronobacter turicensis 564]